MPFTTEQRDQLCHDMATPQDAVSLFLQVTEPKDQAEFFNIARQLVHIDGDYGTQEQDVLLALKEIHVKGINIDALVDIVSLEFEDEK